jgi:2-polyprenyl-6-hydroxyphenyl methylase/3-demethylubiquinone-9 3-methyltransferase
MDRDIEARLAALPRLSREHAAAAAIPCKICGRPAMFRDVTDFQKCVGVYAFGPSGITLTWHACDSCGFLFTPFFDDWSAADFARYIYNDDYPLVDPHYTGERPRAVARVMAGLLSGHESARILDYGGGLGMMAEAMGELGFRHVVSYDPFSIPARPLGRFDIIICNEVIEHTVSPLATIEEIRSMLAEDGCIVLGEVLQPPDIGDLGASWWYIAPRNGHVSTFSAQTFATIAAGCGMIFHRGAGSLHALRTPGGGTFGEIAARCGPSFAAFRLGAPVSVPDDGWSPPEGDAIARFRWSAGVVQVALPFLHESRSGFASQCSIEFNGQAAGIDIRNRTIVAEAGPFEGATALLTLRTPELTGSHGREIGLALLIA